MKKGLVIIALMAVTTVLSAQSTDGLNLVFEDDFANNKSGWMIGETGKDVSWINFDKKLLVIEGSAGEGRITMNSPQGFNGDFVLKASIYCRECAGTKDAIFGLLFGFDQIATKDTQGMYTMRLMQEGGKDAVWIKANNANGSTLYEQKASAAFDPNDATEIAIERKGETVNFYVNGNQIYSNTAAETAGNKISFIVNGKYRVFMSKLSMWAN